MEEAWKISANKKWIKRFSYEESVKFHEYSRKHLFVLVAEVKLDNSKKTDTVIKFFPIIDKQEFSNKQEWLYIITIGDFVVKIGGTRVGLKARFASYIAGHHTKERGKSGDCSKTNAVIYNTIDFYLNFGCEVKVYGYKIPLQKIIVDVLEESLEFIPQTYHVYESKFLEDFKKNYGKYPLLSSNSDPLYKNL